MKYKINISGIDWIKFKEKMDFIYRYIDSKNHLQTQRLLDKIYDRWQKGERTAQIYFDLREFE